MPGRLMRSPTRLTSRLLACCAVVVAVFLLPAGTARAATFTVNSTADAVDASLGDGVCETAPGNGICTLRAAVNEADALPGADTIMLGPGTYTLSIAGAGEDLGLKGDLDVFGRLTIIGGGQASTIVDAAQIDRAFDVLRDGNLSISNVTIRNGRVTGENGGAIRSLGRVDLRSAIVTNSTTSTGDGGGLVIGTSDPPASGYAFVEGVTFNGNTASGSGGGIAALSISVLTVRDSVLTGNTALGAGGAVTGNPFLANVYGPTLVNVTVSGNSARTGGGVAWTRFILGGSITNNHATNGDGGGVLGVSNIVDSTISGNTAVTNGGGLAGVGLIQTSTISGNTAVTGGGGYFGDSVVENSTISGNTVTAGPGGGLLGNILLLRSVTVSGNAAPAGDGGGVQAMQSLRVVSSTVSGNSAGGDGVNSGRGGGIFVGEVTATRLISGSTVTANSAVIGGGLFKATQSLGSAPIDVQNTIVAGNIAPSQCAVSPFATIHSLGHNIDGDSSCAFTGPGDQINTDPLLAALAPNGGPTQTHALQPNSPAIDRGDPAACLATDQRGAPSPFDGDATGGTLCDVGAFEYGAVVTAPTTAYSVNSTSTAPDADPGDGVCATAPIQGEGIRCTLQAAVDEVNLHRAAQTISLPPGEFAPIGNGPFCDISSQSPSALTLQTKVTITGAGPGTVLKPSAGNQRVVCVAAGGDVSLSGMTLTKGHLDNYGTGGGILVNGGILTASDMRVAESQAYYGGGLAVVFGGFAAVSRSTFVGNVGGAAGGGISVDHLSTLTLDASTVSGNTTTRGGGIWVNSGIVNISNTTISGNTSVSGDTSSGGSSGGGLHVDRFADATSMVSLLNVTMSHRVNRAASASSAAVSSS